MAGAGHRILTLNVGSSSLKAAIYAVGPTEERLASAEADRLGGAEARIRFRDAEARVVDERAVPRGDHPAALRAVLDWVQRESGADGLDAIAHRIVHGGRLEGPARVTGGVLESLRRLQAVDPEHMPSALAAIDAVTRDHPELAQIACFDTAFHRTLPAVARAYPLPARFGNAGVRRYGFHGLSCDSIVSALRAIDPTAADRRLIVAHLGSGASLTAVDHGRSVETTMGFSPAGGIMMGTRSGDLDPGVLLYALREEHLTVGGLDRLVNGEAGLLGVSGTSADMRDLLAREATDPRAASAVALFCYQAKKAMGALMAALGGLDTLVFTGGIGEHSPFVRARIISGLEGLGLSIDASANTAGAPVVSTAASRTVIRVIATDEEAVMARQARRVLGI
jgi:acetate kinase